MHDVGIALDGELGGGVDGADLRHPAHVVAAEVEQHQVLGPLLGVGQQLGLERVVLLRRSAAPAGAGDGADGDRAVAHPHQDLGARAHHLEVAEVEIEHVGAGVGAPQRPVERERRQREVQRPALRGHHLEDVAGADVLLGRLDHLRIALGRGVRDRLPDLAQVAVGPPVAHGAVEVHDRVRQPLGRARIGRPRVGGVAGAHRRDEGHLVLHRVDRGHDGRAHHHRVGQAQRVGVGLGDLLHLADHLVAEIAEQARHPRRQAARQLHPALVEHGAQGLERLAGVGLERLGVPAGRAVDLGPVAPAAPHEVGLEADETVAAPRVAPGDAFEHEGVPAGLGQLQHQRDRGLEVGGDGAVNRDVAALRIGRLEGGEIGLDMHLGNGPREAGGAVDGRAAAGPSRARPPPGRRGAAAEGRRRRQRIELIARSIACGLYWGASRSCTAAA